MKKFFFLLLAAGHISLAQNAPLQDSLAVKQPQNLTFNYKQLIIPSALIAYGIVGINSDQIKRYNIELRDELRENIHTKLNVDDVTLFIPAASVYALNLIGNKGRNSLKDQTIILATSATILSGTVFGLKEITHIQRPNETTKNSFPSGHTAIAFAGAEFLYQEYKDKSLWYGVLGYSVATATGLLRIYNNEHWLTDVATGAGIGILSTKIAYWIHPTVSKLFKGSKEKKSTVLLAPSYDGHFTSLCFIKTF